MQLSLNILWSLNFFWIYFYSILIVSLIFFLIPSIKNLIINTKFKSSSNFEYIIGADSLNIIIFLILSLALNLNAWSSNSISLWFGHLIFCNLQYKLIPIILIFFLVIISISCNSFYFSSKESYDYIITCIHLFLWITILFWTNTIFSIIFVIEILSTLIFLLLANSTFSSTHYYNNLNLNLHSYFQNTLPFFFLQTLLFFFWISLISSLNLFFSLLNFYINFLTFDWFLIEHFFLFLINNISLKSMFFFIFVWFNFLFCVFLKCGLVPLFFWKPTFLKGIPLNLFFFYITFFYFFIFLFFIIFFLIYLTEVFYYFLLVNLFMLLMGFLILISILLDTFYLKTFLALSSILNTLFIFLTLNASNLLDTHFIFT